MDGMAVSNGRNAALNISAGEAASLVQSGDWLDYCACLCQPDEFDQALTSEPPICRT